MPPLFSPGLMAITRELMVRDQMELDARFQRDQATAKVDQLEADKDLLLDLIAERNAELETLKKSLEEHQYLLQNFYESRVWTHSNFIAGTLMDFRLEHEGRFVFDGKKDILHSLVSAAHEIPRITLEAN